MSIFAGTNDLEKENEGQRRLVDNCMVHPDYVELNNSDVAVCKLQEPFDMGENIQPVDLDTNYVGGGEMCTLTGSTIKFKSNINFKMNFRLGIQHDDQRAAASNETSKIGLSNNHERRMQQSGTQCGH